jgi:Kef-type K+ transport system membrane component KefB
VSAVGSEAEEVTLRLLYQLIVILLATRLVTALVRRLGQTDVVGGTRLGEPVGSQV